MTTGPISYQDEPDCPETAVPENVEHRMGNLEEQAGLARQAPSRETSTPVVLIVDDLAANLVALESVVRQLGYQVVLANSGSDALKRMLETEFACILMDLRMPGIDGLETAALIRKRERHKDIPLIFLSSGDPSLVELSQAYSLGAVDFVRRPVDSDILKSKIRTVANLYAERALARREKEDELRRGRDRLALLFDQLPLALWSVDENLKLTFCGGSLYGKGDIPTPELLIGKPMAELLPEKDGREHPTLAAHRRALEGQEVTYSEERSGRTYEGCLRPVRDGRGRVMGVLGAAVDITERRRAEEALRKGRAELERELADVQLLQRVGAELILEGNAQALFEGIMDAATRIMRSQYASIQMLSDRGNGKELRLLAFRGFSPEAARFWEYVRPGSGSTCGVALREGRRVIAPDVERCDFMVGTEDLDTCLRTGIRAVQTTPLISRGGAIVGMISTHWREPHEPSERDLRLFDILARQAADLIERRAAEEKLRTLNAELDDRVREQTRALRETVTELDSFAYTVAHDLRSPLRSIHNFGELLREEAAPKLGPVERGYLESIIRAGGRMDSLITDLLSYTRIHRQDVVLEKTDLEAVVSRVLEDLEAELSARNAEVTVSKPLPEVMGHGLLLTQALTNLISNAVKFVAPGTSPRVRISSQKERRRVRVWVEDNGIGIAPEHHPKLFQVFERIDPTEDYPGTGIGLAIVRRAAERMGGTVGVESAVGRGSRFWIDVPIAGPQVPASSPGPS